MRGLVLCLALGLGLSLLAVCEGRSRPAPHKCSLGACRVSRLLARFSKCKGRKARKAFIFDPAANKCKRIRLCPRQRFNKKVMFRSRRACRRRCKGRPEPPPVTVLPPNPTTTPYPVDHPGDGAHESCPKQLGSCGIPGGSDFDFFRCPQEGCPEGKVCCTVSCGRDCIDACPPGAPGPGPGSCTGEDIPFDYVGLTGDNKGSGVCIRPVSYCPDEHGCDKPSSYGDSPAACNDHATTCTTQSDCSSGESCCSVYNCPQRRCVPSISMVG